MEVSLTAGPPDNSFAVKMPGIVNSCTGTPASNLVKGERLLTLEMRDVTVTFMSDCQCIAILTQVTVTFTLKGSSKNSKNFSLRTQSKKRKVRKALI